MENFNPNHDKLGKFAKSNYPKINVSQDCKVKKEIKSAFEQINKVFPSLSIGKYVSVIKEEEPQGDTLARREKDTIYIRKGVTNEEAFEKLENDFALPFNGNKYIKNRKDFSCEIIHEIGHSLAAKESDFWSDFKNKFDFDEEQIATQLTYNALLDNNEFFAEAFADYVINKDNASTIGKLIPKFLKEQGII